MEGYFVRLLRLDKNESYRQLYRSIRKTESKFVTSQVSLAEGQRQHKELRLAVSQCQTVARLVDRWIMVKEELAKLDSTESNSGQTNVDSEKQREILEHHESEIEDAVKRQIGGGKMDESSWKNKGREAITALRLEIINQHRQLLVALEQCEERCQSAEVALSKMQAQRNEEDALAAKIIDEAYQRAAANYRPHHLQNPTEQSQRVWNDLQQGYRIFRTGQLHRKYVLTDNQENFYKELSKLQIRSAEKGPRKGENTQGYSNSANTTIKKQSPQPCNMPLIVEATSDPNSRISTVTLQWSCSAAKLGVTEYQLQRKRGQSADFEVVYEGKGTFCLLDLLPDDYVFRVRARNSSGTGAFSAEFQYIAHDPRGNEKNATLQTMLRNQAMSESCRGAEQKLSKLYQNVVKTADSSRAAELAATLNEANKNRVDLISQDLIQKTVELLQRFWQIPQKNIQQSRWGLKFAATVRDTLSLKSTDLFLKFISSEAWNGLSQDVTNLIYNYLLILGLRALKLNYPAQIVDSTLRVIHQALQSKKHPSNPFWLRRLTSVFELLRRKLQAQRGQPNRAKTNGPVDKRKEEFQKQKAKERRDAERQAARLREQKRKALHEKLWRQQVAQGKIPPKPAKPAPVKAPSPKALPKVVSKFRSYPKHHQQGKFQLCKFWLVGQSCRKQPCWFAHGKEELADWYHQREEEQIRKKQHRKGSGGESPVTGPQEAAKPRVVAKPPPTNQVKTKDVPMARTRAVKPAPAPVVKSVWKSTGPPKRRTDEKIPVNASADGISTEGNLEQELSGIWKGKSSQQNEEMVWQSCELRFSFQGQRGTITGNCICMCHGDSVSFSLEGQIHYPDLTLKRLSSSYASQELYHLRIDRTGQQLKMTGKSKTGGFLTLTRISAKRNENEKANTATKSIGRLLPSPKTESITATPSSRPILAPVESFSSVGSLLDNVKSSPSVNLFAGLSSLSGRSSKDSSPVSLRPSLAVGPSSSGTPEVKADSTPLSLGGLGTIFHPQYGGSTVWGSLNSTTPLSASKSLSSIAPSQEPDFKLPSSVGIGQQLKGVNPSSLRNGGPYSFVLPHVSKSAPSGAHFGFGAIKNGGGVGNSDNVGSSYGSLFSNIRPVKEAKWGAPTSKKSPSPLLGAQTNSFPSFGATAGDSKGATNNSQKIQFTSAPGQIGGHNIPLRQNSQLWRG